MRFINLDIVFGQNCATLGASPKSVGIKSSTTFTGSTVFHAARKVYCLRTPTAVAVQRALSIETDSITTTEGVSTLMTF